MNFHDYKFYYSNPQTLGCKNEKRPFGPIELDLEAGNLVSVSIINYIEQWIKYPTTVQY